MTELLRRGDRVRVRGTQECGTVVSLRRRRPLVHFAGFGRREAHPPDLRLLVGVQLDGKNKRWHFWAEELEAD